MSGSGQWPKRRLLALAIINRLNGVLGEDYSSQSQAIEVLRDEIASAAKLSSNRLYAPGDGIPTPGIDDGFRKKEIFDAR